MDQERGHLRRHVATLRLNNVTQIFRRHMGGADQYTRDVAAGTYLTVDDALSEIAASAAQDPAAPRQIQRRHVYGSVRGPSQRQLRCDRLPPG